MKVLITGTTGRIGRVVLNEFLQYPHIDVSILNRSRHPNQTEYVRQFTYNELNKISQNDFSFDIIVFCHGVNSGDFNHQRDVNARLILRIKSCLNQSKNPRVIYLSTRLVYQGHPRATIDIESPLKPLSPYALSKYLGEEICQMTFINHLIIRVPSVYSGSSIQNPFAQKESNLGIIGLFLNQIRESGEIRVFEDANFIRGFISDFDLANVILGCAIESTATGIVNSPIELNADTFSIAQALSRHLGVEVKTVGPMKAHMKELETGNMIWGFGSFVENISELNIPPGMLSKML